MESAVGGARTDGQAESAAGAEDSARIEICTEGLALLLEALNDPCECEHPTAISRCYDRECSRRRERHYHGLPECRENDVLRWWRVTDKPWIPERPRNVGSIEAMIGEQGMVVLRRMLNGSKKRSERTIANELSRLRLSVLRAQGSRCASCNLGTARYLCKRPRANLAIGAICAQCFGTGLFDVITLRRMMDGDAELSFEIAAA